MPTAHRVNGQVVSRSIPNSTSQGYGRSLGLSPSVSVEALTQEGSDDDDGSLSQVCTREEYHCPAPPPLHKDASKGVRLSFSLSLSLSLCVCVCVCVCLWVCLSVFFFPTERRLALLCSS